jgi:hypothetical protein
MKKPYDSDTAVQFENERYVKYYELQACLKDAFETFSKDINLKLDGISNNTKGLVSYAQHKDDLGKLEDRIDLKYGSTKNNFNKLNWIIITAVINILVPGIMYLLILNKVSL